MEHRSGTLGGDDSIIFPSGNAKPTGSVTFSRDVQNAVVLLTGFDVKFSDENDRHFKRMKVRVTGRLRGDRRTFDVRGDVHFSDKTHLGDAINVTINYVVVADLRSPISSKTVARKAPVKRTKAKKAKKAKKPSA